MRGARWYEVAIAAVLLCGMVFLLFPSVKDAGDVRRRTSQREQLKAVGIALRAYHDRYGSFPPGYVRGPDGQRWHSWRALILAELGETELAREYRLDEPWNGPHNRDLLARRPAVYATPRLRNGRPDRTGCLAVTGRVTCFPDDVSISLDEIQDGPENSLMLVETIASDRFWSEPLDLTFDETQQVVEGSRELGGVYGLFADGHTEFLRSNIGSKAMRNMYTASGGSPFSGRKVATIRPHVVEYGPPFDTLALQHTRIVPETSVPLDAATTLVYSGAFTSALKQWNPAAATPIHGTQGADRSLPGVLLLTAPSPAERFQLARETLADRLPDMKSVLADLHPDEGVVVGALDLHLPYAVEFERLAEPLPFKGEKGARPVQSFGLREFEAREPGIRDLKEQVRILNYVSPDEFTVALRTLGPADEVVILAKRTPEATLDQTIARVWSVVEAKALAETETIQSGDTLIAPVITFNLRHRRPDIEQTSPAGQRINYAAEYIRYPFFERGAHRISENRHLNEQSTPVPRPARAPRQLVLDAPFLLLVRSGQSPVPLFSAWVANDELMRPFETPDSAARD